MAAKRLLLLLIALLWPVLAAAQYYPAPTTPLSGSEVIPCIQSGGYKSCTPNLINAISGTVTSVGLALPGSVFSVSGSPVTGAGTLTGSFLTQNANTVLAGPATAPAAAPTFRQLACADLSNASASCSTDATNAGNISAGVLAAARGGAGTVTGILQANGSGTVSAVTVGAGLTFSAGTLSANVTSPGGSSGQVQYNNAGAFGGFTVGGDGALNTGTGALTVTKTNGVNFAASATTDTTSASNISSGTLASARGGAGTVSGALKGNGAGVVSQAACADLSDGASGGCGGVTVTSWTPTLTFATPGDLSVTYSTRQAQTLRMPGVSQGICFATWQINTSAFTFTTASGSFQITGLSPAPNGSYVGQSVGASALQQGWTGSTTSRAGPYLIGGMIQFDIGNSNNNTVAATTAFTSGTNILVAGSMVYPC